MWLGCEGFAGGLLTVDWCGLLVSLRASDLVCVGSLVKVGDMLFRGICAVMFNSKFFLVLL